MTKNKSITVFTLGHATRSLEELITLLQHYAIKHLIDIRTIPKSRHNPQFNEKELSKNLSKAHIKYTHMKDLGGFRRPLKDSINTGWRNLSFRGYADYMQTDTFAQAIDQLIKYAQQDQIAIMCSEAVPWRCHRSLIGDALLARHIDVEDIISLTSCKPHTMTPWARVKQNKVTYPS